MKFADFDIKKAWVRLKSLFDSDVDTSTPEEKRSAG